LVVGITSRYGKPISVIDIKSARNSDSTGKYLILLDGCDASILVDETNYIIKFRPADMMTIRDEAYVSGTIFDKGKIIKVLDSDRILYDITASQIQLT